MNRRRLALALVLALPVLFCPATSHAAPKTDVLTLLNGNKITGEVMGLSSGKLDYKTDDIGRLSVEWVKVALLTSPHVFEVEMWSGVKFIGRLGATDSVGTIVVYGMHADTLVIPNVVRMTPLDAGFWQRVKAYLDLGFTVAKANHATTLTTGGEIAYRGDKFGSTLAFDSYAQGQESTATATQNGVSLKGVRYLAKRYSVTILGSVEQNSELNLDLRATGGAAFGRVIHQSNQSEVGAGAGLVVAYEDYGPTSSGTGVGSNIQTNLDARLSVLWDAFHFDSPTLDFSTELNVYPSLTNAGRIRGDFSTRLKYELFSDFDAGINFTDSFDNRPPEEDASHNDYILSFTIGWSYRR